MFVARRRALLRLLIAVATASVAVSVPGSSAAQTQGQQSGDAEWTMGYGNQRTNWDDDQPRLGPDSVTSPDFGKIFDTTLPGTTASAPNQVYAQPIVADGVLVVATEENQVAGLDPGTGVVEWQVSLGTPWTPTSCGDLLPHVGITSTPVYDSGNALRLLGNCVDVIGAGTANHTHVQLYRCNGTPAQQWLQRSGYMLYNPNSGKCLDDPGATTTLSTQLEIYQCNETPSQHWYLDW